MRINRFNKAKAVKAHGGSILADDIISDKLNPPFGHAWGYLEAGGEMETHAHPTEEVYLIVEGNGQVNIEGEVSDVKAGDVVEIPPDNSHSIACKENENLLWAAFWWDKKD
ncbi:MAG: cupin domain-containing protein [Bacillota bacterium]